MQIIGTIFQTLFFAPIVNLLVILLHFLQSLGVPGALGFAIILLSLIIRLLVWPFMSTQLKAAQKMAELRPHLDVIKKKHKGDKQALAQAQMALYKEHGVNPAGGCLPALIQLPILWALAQVSFALFEGEGGLEKINTVLYQESWKLQSIPDLHFLGINLATKPSDVVFSALLLVPILTALLQFVQSKMMTPSAIKQYPSDSSKEKKEKESMEDTMAAVQSQMLYMMPLMVGYFAFQFPIGLALYWNTLTLVGIYQQHRISGWGGMADLIKRFSSYRA